METANQSSGATLTVPIKDKDGRDFFSVCLKRSFLISPDGKIEDLDSTIPVQVADTFWGEDPAASSIRNPSQLFLRKPGTDVVLLGKAYPPSSGAQFADVTLRVGDVRKVVRASGLSVWTLGLFGGLTPGPPRPIQEPVPLQYELAWGGMDVRDGTRPVGEPRNYVGRGVSLNPRELVGQMAAQLWYPDQPIGGKTNVPAAFNPIHRHWQPRARFAGTYDQAWMESRMPLLPADFDDRFNVCVPDDQWSPTPLRSDVVCDIRGATPEPVWRFQLPRINPGFSSIVQGQRTEHRTHLDTIVIDSEARTVELTWRAAIPTPRKHEMIERVIIFEKGMALVRVLPVAGCRFRGSSARTVRASSIFRAPTTGR